MLAESVEQKILNLNALGLSPYNNYRVSFFCRSGLVFKRSIKGGIFLRWPKLICSTVIATCVSVTNSSIIFLPRHLLTKVVLELNQKPFELLQE